MPTIALSSRPMAISVIVGLVVAATLSSNSAGVQSGTGGIPANASSGGTSCATCHTGSAPSTASPDVSLTIANNRRALAQGQTISATVTVANGVTGTRGGFLCETTDGTFTPGATTRQLTNLASITHNGSANRTWTFSFNAPSTPGLVSLTAVGMSAGDPVGTGGDRIGFTGFDRAATSATPVRLFVLPTDVTNTGSGCPDGFGNYSVLGTNGRPQLGNSSFAFQLHGAAPGAFAVVWAGINPAGFTSTSLAPFGIPGCTAYLANFYPYFTATTTGVASSVTAQQRAEGSANFPLPIPSTPALSGQEFDVQAGYIDPSVASFRPTCLSFSNGLHLRIQ